MSKTRCCIDIDDMDDIVSIWMIWTILYRYRITNFDIVKLKCIYCLSVLSMLHIVSISHQYHFTILKNHIYEDFFGAYFHVQTFRSRVIHTLRRYRRYGIDIYSHMYMYMYTTEAIRSSLTSTRYSFSIDIDNNVSINIILESLNTIINTLSGIAAV